MKIEILGTGCYKCIKLDQLPHEVLKELDREDFVITRINDESYIRKYLPLDDVPGLIINGMLASTRELPTRESLVEWFSGIPIAGKKDG